MKRESQARSADAFLLERRLRELGLGTPGSIQVHENRSVLVSITAKEVLRIHRGYAYAPDRVLDAVVRFANPSVRGRERRRAARELLQFPVERYTRSGRPRPARHRMRREDRPLVTLLRQAHERLNRFHFEGKLSRIRLMVSRRMTRRLGEFRWGEPGMNDTITISHGHLTRDPWPEVEHTLLHEMIHQWQHENGHAVDHGTTFRNMARRLGIVPRASRSLDRRVPTAG